MLVKANTSATTWFVNNLSGDRIGTINYPGNNDQLRYNAIWRDKPLGPFATLSGAHHAIETSERKG